MNRINDEMSPQIRDGISYEILTLDRLDEAIECLCIAFGTGEPIFKVLGVTPAELRVFGEPMCILVIPQGLSMWAKDITSGALMGCLISEDYATERPNTMSKLPPNAEPYVAIGQRVEAIRAKTFERRKGSVAHQWMLGVWESHQGRNIGFNLAEASEKLFKSRGFEQFFRCLKI